MIISSEHLISAFRSLTWKHRTKEDCVVPLQFPIRDPVTGAQTSELLITQGTSVYIGLAAPNMSRAIWGDDVHEFKPERWFNKMGTETTENSIKMPGIYGNMSVRCDMRNQFV